MKYAVIEHGGKQFKTQEGESIEIDRIPVEVGNTVEFKDVLLFVDGRTIKVGSPLVQGGNVKGRVSAQAKAKKIVVFKYRPKQRYRKKQGHRQPYTRIDIESVSLAQPKAEVEKDAEKPKAEKPAVEKKPAAAKQPAPKSTGTRKPKAKASGAKAPAKKSPPPKTGSTKGKGSTSAEEKSKKPSTRSSKSSSGGKQQEK